MKVAKVDYTDEKIALAKELGLPHCAVAMEQIKTEMAEITSLTFKTISDAEMDKFLEKRLFIPFRTFEDSINVFFGVGIIGEAIATIIGAVVWAADGRFHTAILPFEILSYMTATGCTLIFLFSSFPKCRRATIQLSEWGDPLPRGALLAVKEAKTQGINRFEIHYPLIQHERIFSDPIITGYKGQLKKRLMIHTWDDGKIYE